MTGPSVSRDDGRPDAAGQQPRDDRVLLTVDRAAKHYVGVRALHDVSFGLRAGEILALAGQNGSGKSTLVKALAGVVKLDAGRIDLDPRGAAYPTALHFIHQDLGLIDTLSTVENIDVGGARQGRALRYTRRAAERRHADELMRSFGCRIDVEAPVKELTASERAIVAIARALDAWSVPDNILILDEPTARLHRREADVLFEAIRRVAARGAGVVFVSHHLDEVLGLATRALVLRDGKAVADQSVADLDHDRLVNLIVGSAVEPPRRAEPASLGPVRLSAHRLRGGAVRDLDLQLRGGEIVGISGALGSGREDVAPLIFGQTEREGGEVRIDGDRLHGGVRAAISRGVAYLPGDRHRQSAVMSMRVRENMTLPRLHPLCGPAGRLSVRRERADVAQWSARVALRADPEKEIALLSGGNQQKVVIAKWLRLEPAVMLLSEPTQGVDIGAKSAIHDLIKSAAAQGTAILVASSDVPELATICDRVIVMRDGRVISEVTGDLSEERLVREGLGSGTARPDGKDT